MNAAAAAALQAAGFAVAQSGGDCTAWVSPGFAKGERYTMITQAEDASHDFERGESVCVGFYGAEGQPLGDIVGVFENFPESLDDAGHDYVRLRDAQGAILGWQVAQGDIAAFQAAHEAGAIGFDDGTDCYVHPDARRIGDGYTMKRGA